MTTPHSDETNRTQARQTIEDLPAEDALGHRDPQGGGSGEPADYEHEHGDVGTDQR